MQIYIVNSSVHEAGIDRSITIGVKMCVRHNNSHMLLHTKTGTKEIKYNKLSSVD